MNRRDIKKERIEAAAFELLEEKGYHNTSMLQIAKRAGASNQTLYAWYGNKQKLFQHIIEKNGATIIDTLNQSIKSNESGFEALEKLGPLLLSFITSEKAVVINRAAVADAAQSGLLAQAIDEGIRNKLIALIESIIRNLIGSGELCPDSNVSQVAETYISLLFGELQFRQALGKQGQISEQLMEERTSRAITGIKVIYKITSNRDS